MDVEVPLAVAFPEIGCRLRRDAEPTIRHGVGSGLSAVSDPGRSGWGIRSSVVCEKAGGVHDGGGGTYGAPDVKGKTAERRDEGRKSV